MPFVFYKKHYVRENTVKIHTVTYWIIFFIFLLLEKFLKRQCNNNVKKLYGWRAVMPEATSNYVSNINNCKSIHLEAEDVANIKIKILLVDDHAIVREGLRRIINDTKDINIVEEASTGEEALLLIDKNKFDLILVDISMPGKNGLQTLKDIKKFNSKLPVLMLSMHAEEQYAMRAIKAGASGYLTKDSASDQLVKAIKKVFDGRKDFSQDVAELLVTDIYHKEDKLPHDYLSDREFEILKLIVRGNSAKNIANNLKISDKTVSTYRSRILKKMGMKSTSDMIHYAIETNISD